MNKATKYFGLAALLLVCEDGLGQNLAEHERLVTLPVLPALVRESSFARDMQPLTRQSRNTADFGNALDNRAQRDDGKRLSWGIIGAGLGFNKRF
jgi:hypothetical protein